MGLPTCCFVEKLGTGRAGNWAGLSIESFLAPTTPPISRDLGEGSLDSLGGTMLEREDGIVDAKNVVRGELSTLFEHWESHVLSKPYRARCGVWHLKIPLDLN